MNLDCNGVRNLRDDNYDKTYTDSDGNWHHDASQHTEKLSGDFKTNDGMDLLTKVPANNQRVIEVKFENGNLTLVDSRLIPVVSSSGSRLDHIPLDRIQVGDDTYVTVRIYAPSSKELEIRMKMEYPADQDGNRTIEFSKVVYGRI